MIKIKEFYKPQLDDNIELLISKLKNNIVLNTYYGYIWLKEGNIYTSNCLYLKQRKLEYETFLTHIANHKYELLIFKETSYKKNPSLSRKINDKSGLDYYISKGVKK